MTSVSAEEEKDRGEETVLRGKYHRVGGPIPCTLKNNMAVTRRFAVSKARRQSHLLYVCAHCAIKWTPSCALPRLRPKEMNTVFPIVCHDMWHKAFLTEEDGVLTM
jgi:hypothetical protein